MGLPDLDELIAEVDRNCDARVLDGAEQPDWLALLETSARIASQLRVLADDLVTDYVEHCRMHGYSWTEIGGVLGVTRQAAQQRFDAPHKQYVPDAFTADLREAMAQMKKAAVRYRNNYIGTQHLLWGLTAQTNNATRLLRAAGASPQDLHQAVEDRMTAGASQAAKRIAWTPYARKAIALAEQRARRAASAHIDCDHLLFGISEVGRGMAATLLGDAGVGTRTLDDAAEQLAANEA